MSINQLPFPLVNPKETSAVLYELLRDSFISAQAEVPREVAIPLVVEKAKQPATNFYAPLSAANRHNVVDCEGTVYVVHTEDIGVESALVVTWITIGTLVFSKRETSYAEWIDTLNVDECVSSIVDVHHSLAMLELKSGTCNVALAS